MRTDQKIIAASFLAILLIGFNKLASPGEDRGDDYYRQRDELIAAEKNLLRQEDAVSGEVFEVKRTINDLYKKLSSMQSQQDSLRHQIISVRMKLLQ
jgi:hypothetical protein